MVFGSWVLKATGFNDSNLTDLRTWSRTADQAKLGIRLGGNLNSLERTDDVCRVYLPAVTSLSV